MTMTTTIPLGPFLGMNNRLPDFDLHVPKMGDFLSNAIDIDFDNGGNIRGSTAPSLVQAMVGGHSLHMVSDTAGYLVRAGVMYAITLPAYSETLFKVLTTDDLLSYAQVGGDLYYSNGTDSGRITAGAWFPIGLPTPASPTCLAIAGTMYAGSYQIAVSYYNSATKEEGGISPSSNPALDGVGGLRVSLPAAVPGATHVLVYATPVNGSVPMLAATLSIGADHVDFTAPLTSFGRQITGRIDAPLPAGDLFESNGRLCSIKDNIVYVGLPYKRGYYEPGEGFIHFASPVSIAVANEGGTYIAADKTYFVPGDLGNAQDKITDVLPYGAVKGTVFRHPKKQKVVGWFSTKGVVVVDEAGQPSPLMADKIDQTPPANGFSVVLFSRGYHRVISCGWCVNLETGAPAINSGLASMNSASGGYCLGSAGLHLVEGSGPVDAVACFGKLNFGTDLLKHMPSVYVGVASGEPMELIVGYTDERGDSREYAYEALNSGESLQVQRFDVGRGIRANWFELTLKNTGGEDFCLTSVGFAPTVTSRRI